MPRHNPAGGTSKNGQLRGAVGPFAVPSRERPMRPWRFRVAVHLDTVVSDTTPMHDDLVELEASASKGA